MIQIYIDNKLIDLDNTNISLQKEFATEVENIPTEVEYSYTISIPATLNNKEVFGFVETFDVGNKFARIYNAELYVDESLILSGKFKMTSIEEGHYKGNIYNPKRKTISDILGDRNLNEIKPHYKPMNGIGDFDKTNNTACNIYGSDYSQHPERTFWSDWRNHPQYNEICDNHIIYPYVLYGLPMHNVDNIPSDMDIFTQDLAYDVHNINENNVFPAFNVLSVFKDIFATEGYNLTGNIFDTENAAYFNKLYQTFQYAYADYAKLKEIPFFCEFNGHYQNIKPIKKTGQTNTWEISPTLEITDLNDFEQSSYTVGSSDDDDNNETPTRLKYGVDNPMQCGGENGSISVITDEKNMLVSTSDDKNIRYIMIPKSGWYKINCSGNMNYKWKGHTYWTQEDRENVGGTLDEADNTDLSEQPFEFQIKKGSPKDSPKLYSYNSLLPCVPTDFPESNYNYVVNYDCDDTYVRLGSNDKQRRYGKNEKTTLINDYSNFSTSDFICGARLGDAWFNGRDDWNQAYSGVIRRPNRFLQFGAGLTLPDVSKTIITKNFTNSKSQCNGKKRGNSRMDREGRYFKVSDKNNTLSYNYRTAQALVRKDSYSNFEGYNQLKISSGSLAQVSWDTTTNYGKVTYEGAESSSAKTTDKYSGEWNVNTVVWLEQNDVLYVEVLMPVHFGSRYSGGDTSSHSRWLDEVEWVNGTIIDYHIKLGFLNSNKDWSPKPNNGINTWDDISELKLTNVNQFLPSTKCNDYLEKFLKTFNLQLTMVNDNTFSIDSNVNLNLTTNVIDIDKLTNVDDAEFKPLSSESIRQLCWKNDLSETGYLQGNNSPYSEQDVANRNPWDDSGYTGNYSIVNEANTSGSVKKIESQWSYNWYKTIRFLHPAFPDDKDYAIPSYDEQGHFNGYYYKLDVPVACDADYYRNGSSFYAYASETPQTTKTSRLFFLESYNSLSPTPTYVDFIYKHENYYLENGMSNGYRSWCCNLIVPSKYCYTTYYEGNTPINIKYYLDYNKMRNKTQKGITDKFFDENINGGYQIDVPIKLSNQQYADVNAGTLFKFNDGLFKIKSIEGHDVNKEDDATLSLLTLK